MTTTAPTASEEQARDLARRSVEIILEGQAPSGAFIAGPTFGQYRYAWLRDGAFIAEALDLVGRGDAAARFHAWVASLIIAAEDGIERSIAAVAEGRSPAPADYLHCRYEADGSLGPDDWPTFQLDGPGIWLWSLAHHARHGGTIGLEHRRAATLATRYLAALWDQPSYDAWEESPDHVHTSTLAAILAGLRAAGRLMDGSSSEEAARAAAEALVADRLLRPDQAFTKWDGNPAVDGSLLWMSAPYELVGPDHPAFAATLRRIETDLVSVDGGVHRYVDDTYYGGGEWLLLTGALGRVYLRRAAAGDRDRAIGCLRWIERQAGPDGSLPEQVATRAPHPERIAEWEASWGTSASPLLWSHATYLALLTELG
ncbi:MAG: glycoside hydrolase family 15 protein [Candidatus Limnocylindrales bacterium]